MKKKSFITITFAIFITGLSYGQDTSTYTLGENTKTTTQSHIYRDTRLGSSSPLYDTYEKNNFGAGAVTTDPNKSSSSINYLQTPVKDSFTINNHVYNDTRLGSSSPLYDTYKKNNFGAGAVTTNTNKR